MQSAGDTGEATLICARRRRTDARDTTTYEGGPGGAYTPSRDADWHLLVGDDAALPAIAAALPRLPAGVPARVLVEVPSAADVQDLSVGPEVQLVWVHREDREPGTALLAAGRPAGTVHAFLHGEAGFVRALRRHLRADRMLVPDLTSISGGWRLSPAAGAAAAPRTAGGPRSRSGTRRSPRRNGRSPPAERRPAQEASPPRRASARWARSWSASSSKP